jgi:pimeloyl-[acyl-carrier protein] methyl ester esterase
MIVLMLMMCTVKTMSEARHLRGTILWLHGWATAPEVWRSTTAFLDEYEHRFVDYRSCSKMEDFVAACECAVQSVQSVQSVRGPLTLIGWSLGGMVALEWLLRHWTAEVNGLDRVEVCKVVLVGSTLCFVDRTRERGWPEAVLRRMMANVAVEHAAQVEQEEQVERVEQTLVGFRLMVMEPYADDEKLETSLSTHDFSVSGLHAGLEYLLTTDLRPLWLSAEAQLRQKVYWMHGAVDRVCPLAAMPDDLQTRAVVFEAAGHAPFLTEEARFVDELRRMLDGD